MNQGNSSSRRGKQQGSAKFVPVKMDCGVSALVNTDNISADKWTHCHGKAQSTGQPVNSLKIAQIGQSTVIQTESGFASSFNSNEIEVAAKVLLENRGYKVNYQGQNNG